VDGDHNNIAPRFGLAYSVTRKFAIRSGAGVFYARRDQNTQVTHIGANIPNVPTIPFPIISASDTVTPPVTLHTPIAVSPIRPDVQPVHRAVAAGVYFPDAGPPQQ
jgi:hypothetical protein